MASALVDAALGGATSSTSSFSLMQYFPISVEWIGLFVLAGGIPIPPFSYLGFGATNLWAVNAMSWYFAKAGLQAMLVLGNTFLTVYYPNLWWVGYLLVLNPWYVFDIVQMFSPAFAYEGYKVPFTTFNPAKPMSSSNPIDDGNGGLTRAYGLITPALLTMILGLIGSGTYGFLNMLPPSVTATYKPVINIIFAVIGGVTALAGGGVASMVALPGLINSLRSNTTELKAVLASSALPSSPQRATSALPSTPQRGGGMTNLPSIEEVANKILKKSQSGGSFEEISSGIFMAALSFVTIGGISLALIRSSAESAKAI
jgi:hypothetical protein